MSFISSNKAPGEIPFGSAQQRLVDAHFQAHVSKWRDVYDETLVEGAIYRKRQEIALGWIDELAMSAGEKVLEVGCGGGRCTVALAQRGYLVHAIDSVSEMVDSAQQLAVEAGVRSSTSINLGYAHDLAFEDDAFGLVVSIGVLPYLDTPLEALREMARVLRPGGFLLVTAGNRSRLNHLLDPWLTPALQSTKRAVGALWRNFRKARPDRPRPRLRLESLRELEGWFSAVGLAKVKARTVGFPPLTFNFHQIFGEQTSLRLNCWLQMLADRDVPAIRSSGMDHVILARKSEERE